MFSFTFLQKKQTVANTLQETQKDVRRAERDWHRALLGASLGAISLLGVGVWMFFFIQRPYPLVVEENTTQSPLLDQTELVRVLEGYSANSQRLSDMRLYPPIPPRVGAKMDSSRTITATSSVVEKKKAVAPQIVP